MPDPKPPDKPETLLSALLAVQKEVPYLRLGKDATGQVAGNRNYRYLTLDKLMAEVLPLLNRYGLVWVTAPENSDQGPVLRYEIMHIASENGIGGTMPLMLDKATSQGLGSAITYARRYSLCSVLGITADEDDDGAKASEQSTQRLAVTGRPTTVKTADDQNRELSENRLMTDEEQNILAKAIADAGAKLPLLLASVGAEDQDGLTVRQGREIMKKLKS